MEQMEQRENYVPVVILGATVKALGIASVLCTKALILEKSCLIGSEFVDTFDMQLKKQPGAENTELEDKLRDREAISENKVLLPAVSASLFELAKEKNLKLCFKTVVLSIEKREEEYLVTYYNASGISQIWTSCIYDTAETILGDERKIEKKYLNIMLSGKADDKDRNMGSQYVSLSEGFYEDEWILKMEVQIDETWQESRKRFFEYWEQKKEMFCPWKVAYIASTFEFLLSETQEMIGKHWEWVPSNTGQGVLQAFYEGVQIGGKQRLLC